MPTNRRRPALATRAVMAVLIASGLAVGSPVSGQQRDRPRAEGTNFAHVPGTPLRTPDDTLPVQAFGAGTTPVILIAGHEVGRELYDALIEHRQDDARFFLAIPPGMAMTPAYAWPDPPEEFITRPWSTAFENALVHFIDTHLEEKPVLVAAFYSGLGMALHIADRHPDRIRGLVLAGPAGRMPYYRWYQADTSAAGPTFDVEAQRARIAQFIPFWRRVPETVWHRNVFGADFFSTDSLTGTRIVYRQAMQPVPISQRYFIEFIMDDLSQEVRDLQLPTLILATLPDDAYLTRRAREGTAVDGAAVREALRTRLHRDWEANRKPNIRIEVFEDTGLLVWHDRPAEFGRLFRQFLQETSTP